MKTLYIVRHAKSSWADPELIDHQRPLSKRGIRDAPFMGEVLKQRHVFPNMIISSSAVRSKLTAEALAVKLGYPREGIQYTMTMYFQGLNPILKMLCSLPARTRNVMLVGHNPDLTELHNTLSPSILDNIPTAGVVGLSFDIKEWSEIEKKAGKRVFYDCPRHYFPKKNEQNPSEFGIRVHH